MTNKLKEIAKEFNTLAIAAPDRMWTVKLAHPRMEAIGDKVKYQYGVWCEDTHKLETCSERIGMTEAARLLRKLRRDLK